MSDNIWSNRFLQRGSSPAWHHKGLLVGKQSLTAEMMLHLAGSYEVSLHPLFLHIKTPSPATLFGPNIKTIASGYSQIVRHPVWDDPEYRVFGAPVSDDYELITPLAAARIWDNALLPSPIGSFSFDQPVVPSTSPSPIVPTETFGVLNGGRELFISARAGDALIGGKSLAASDLDRIDQYLVMYSPMYSNTSAVLVSTCVRPVCQNTLTLGIQQATSKMVIPHLPGAKEKLFEWIRTMYAASSRILVQATSDFNKMSHTPVRSLMSSTVLTEVYPDPPTPDPSWAFGVPYETHLTRFEEKLASIRAQRQLVMNLFGGDGMGQDTPAAMGTLWGLYNAIAEYEDNRRGPAASRAISVIAGERSAIVRRAYYACMRHVLA